LPRFRLPSFLASLSFLPAFPSFRLLSFRLLSFLLIPESVSVLLLQLSAFLFFFFRL